MSVDFFSSCQSKHVVFFEDGDEKRQVSGEAGIRLMHDICRKIWQDKQWPHEWTKVIFVPLPKAGDLKECKNYRNVSLICHASRVTLCIILNRFRQYSERELPEEQAGFGVGWGTRHMLFILQLVIEKTLELEEKEVYLTFVDYSKAFDTVDHRMFFETMIEMGIPYHLVQLIEATKKQ